MLTQVRTGARLDPLRRFEGVEATFKRCVLCGAVLDLRDGREPMKVLEGRSGRRNVRVLMLGGREIHRCEVP